MKRNKFIVTFLLCVVIILTFSCNNHYSVYYSNLIKSYPSDFVNHFPKKIIKGRIHVTGNGEYDVTRLFLLLKDATKNYSTFKDSINKKVIAKYSAQDTCLFVVNRFTTEQNFTLENKANDKDIANYLKKKCLKNKIPIPNFWGFYDENITTIPKLPKNFNIYVLDAKKGLFWDKKHISNGEYMPDFWKHGYSKGVAMNDKTHEIIYWFVLW